MSSYPTTTVPASELEPGQYVGCCNAPDWSDAECWVIGADAETDRLLGASDDDRREITWAPCPLVPYPERRES